MPLPIRSEEHTSELQSHDNLVCRLLLEKKAVTPVDIPARAAHTLPAHAQSLSRARPGGAAVRGGPLMQRAVRTCAVPAVFFFLKTRPPPDSPPFPPPAAFRS